MKRRLLHIAAALAVVTLLGAAPAPRGHPASRLSDGGGASEYWDLVARFDSQHTLFARFMITNEGPGERTGVAYGHFVEPDGTTRFFSNGRREGRWSIDPQGLKLEIGSSELDLRKRPYQLRVHKKKKGVDIDLRITPDGPAAWDAKESGDAASVDLLALAAPISGSVWFRGMPEPVQLTGRAGLSHTWMERGEPELSLRRIDFFSFDAEQALYLRDHEAPDGTRARWLAIARNGKIVHQTGDFELSSSGRSPAQSDPQYPVPGSLQFRGPTVDGRIGLGVGLVHHDPMENIPQPFRFLLSFRLRPHRVWTESSFEIAFQFNSDQVRIRGSGISTVTYLNPNKPPASVIPPPDPGV